LIDLSTSCPCEQVITHDNDLHEPSLKNNLSISLGKQNICVLVLSLQINNTEHFENPIRNTTIGETNNLNPENKILQNVHCLLSYYKTIAPMW
jgi:hypothetical protein